MSKRKTKKKQCSNGWRSETAPIIFEMMLNSVGMTMLR